MMNFKHLLIVLCACLLNSVQKCQAFPGSGEHVLKITPSQHIGNELKNTTTLEKTGKIAHETVKSSGDIAEKATDTLGSTSGGIKSCCMGKTTDQQASNTAKKCCSTMGKVTDQVSDTTGEIKEGSDKLVGTEVKDGYGSLTKQSQKVISGVDQSVNGRSRISGDTVNGATNIITPLGQTSGSAVNLISDQGVLIKGVSSTADTAAGKALGEPSSTTKEVGNTVDQGEKEITKSAVFSMGNPVVMKVLKTILSRVWEAGDLVNGVSNEGNQGVRGMSDSSGKIINGISNKASLIGDNVGIGNLNNLLTGQQQSVGGIESIVSRVSSTIDSPVQAAERNVNEMSDQCLRGISDCYRGVSSSAGAIGNNVGDLTSLTGVVAGNIIGGVSKQCMNGIQRTMDTSSSSLEDSVKGLTGGLQRVRSNIMPVGSGVQNSAEQAMHGIKVSYSGINNVVQPNLTRLK